MKTFAKKKAIGARDPTSPCFYRREQTKRGKEEKRKEVSATKLANFLKERNYGIFFPNEEIF